MHRAHTGLQSQYNGKIRCEQHLMGSVPVTKWQTHISEDGVDVVCWTSDVRQQIRTTELCYCNVNIVHTANHKATQYTHDYSVSTKITITLDNVR